MIIFKALESLFVKMAIFMKEIGWMVEQRVKEDLYKIMVKAMMVIGLKI